MVAMEFGKDTLVSEELLYLEIGLTWMSRFREGCGGLKDRELVKGVGLACESCSWEFMMWGFKERDVIVRLLVEGCFLSSTT